MANRFRKVEIPQYVIEQHKKNIPDRWIFYRPMGSRLFRIQYHPEMSSEFVDVLLEHCIHRSGIFFVHSKKMYDMVDIFNAYGMHDIVFSEPDPVFWN